MFNKTKRTETTVDGYTIVDADTPKNSTPSDKKMILIAGLYVVTAAVAVGAIVKSAVAVKENI